jgi:hypothetical protein
LELAGSRLPAEQCGDESGQGAEHRDDVATQTVGVYPDRRKAELCDALACAGVHRVVSLGGAGGMPPGLSRDGFYPLQRLMRWVNDE